MQRPRIRFEKRDTRLLGVTIRIVIVKRGDVEGQPFADLGSLTELIGNYIFGWEPLRAKARSQVCDAVRTYERIVAGPNVRVEARGVFRRPGNPQPHRVMRPQSPKQAEVRIECEPAVRVVLQF